MRGHGNDVGHADGVDAAERQPEHALPALEHVADRVALARVAVALEQKKGATPLEEEVLDLANVVARHVVHCLERVKSCSISRGTGLQVLMVTEFLGTIEQ